MIFVTVGTQLPFDRLIRAVDSWAGHHSDVEVRAQTGHIGSGGYHPCHMADTPILDPGSSARLFDAARLVIAHAGTGSLLQAAACRTPILIMPRKAVLGEHRTDHQMATAHHFGSRPGVHVVYEEAEVAAAIDSLLGGIHIAPEFGSYAEPQLIATVRSVIFPRLQPGS